MILRSSFYTKLIKSLFYTFLLVYLTACTVYRSYTVVEDKPTLMSIHIIDRNGLTETISNPERLCEFACINFLRPQPYKKVLRVFEKDCYGNSLAIITSYYENGEVQKYLEVSNNRAYGKYREWYDNGILHLEANIIGGLADITLNAEKSWIFDGESFVWDESGNLLASIHYFKGKLDGDSLYYYPSGQLWKRIPYVAGLQQGIFEIYYQNGSVLQTISYENDLRQGPAMRYWQNGSLAAEEFFQEGKLLSGKYYDRQQKLISCVENGTGQRPLFSATDISELHSYSNGVAEGEVRVFDPNGNLIKTWIIKAGEKHGPEIEYYPQFSSNQPLGPKLEVNWYQGKIQGLVKTWYDNGTQESQKEVSGNSKNGILTAWYRNGSIMLIEEYEDDKLIKGEYYRRNERRPVSEVDQGEGIAFMFDAEGNFLRKIQYKHGKPRE